MSYETVRWTLFPLTFCAVTYGQRGQSHPTLRGAAAVGLRRPLHAADGLAQCAGALCLFFGRAVQHNGPRLSLTFRTVTFFSESTLAARAGARGGPPRSPQRWRGAPPPNYRTQRWRVVPFPSTARDAGAAATIFRRDAGAARLLPNDRTRRWRVAPSPIYRTRRWRGGHLYRRNAGAARLLSTLTRDAGAPPSTPLLSSLRCVVDPERTWRARGHDTCTVRTQGLS
jgi:hypothetical protein